MFGTNLRFSKFSKFNIGENDEMKSNSDDDSVICEVELVEDTRESPNRTPHVKIDLRDAQAIRRELGSVYRDMRGRRIETQEGTRLAYVLDMIRKAYETGVLQERLEAIEATVKPRKLRR